MNANDFTADSFVAKCAWAVMCGLVIARSTSLAQDSSKDYRPYNQGPLTAADFRGKPDSNQFEAYTCCSIQYNFRYRYETRGNVTTAKLADVDFFAVILRDKSWNVSTDKKSLMDHEQGHFDIAQASALATKFALLKQIKSDVPLTATGNSEETAVANLQQKLNAAIQVIERKIDESHAEYDRQTKHGRDGNPQREHRAQQLKLVKYYTEEIQRLAGK